MIPGTFLLPIGLLLTGWTARTSVHWIVPDIGIVIIGAGMILNLQSIQTYIIDAFTLHAASGEPRLLAPDSCSMADTECVQHSQQARSCARSLPLASRCLHRQCTRRWVMARAAQSSRARRLS